MSTEVFVRGSAPQSTRRRRRWTGPALAVLVVVVTTTVVFEPPSSGRTYDPASTGPDGLAVLVDVLDELGVDVEVMDRLPDPAGVDAVVLPPLGWLPAQVEGLAGAGVRVVAVFPPHPEAETVDLAFTGIGLVTRDVDCRLLSDVDALRSTTWTAWQPPVGSLPDGAEQCVTGDGGAAWATVVPVGDGEVVALGTFAPLINDRMREQDAAVAAVRLLDVGVGDRVVALTEPGAAGETPTLVDLIDRRWFDAAWLTLLVLVLAAVARGRRLGRPVEEQLPVRVPSGELARAVGDLRHRVGANAAAGEVLRARTLAIVGTRLGLGGSPSGEETVAALRAAGVVLDDADAHVLASPAPATLDEEGLTGLGGRLARIRDALRRGGQIESAPAGSAPAPSEPPGAGPTDDGPALARATPPGGPPAADPGPRHPTSHRGPDGPRPTSDRPELP